MTFLTFFSSTSFSHCRTITSEPCQRYYSFLIWLAHSKNVSHFIICVLCTSAALWVTNSLLHAWTGSNRQESEHPRIQLRKKRTKRIKNKKQSASIILYKPCYRHHSSVTGKTKSIQSIPLLRTTTCGFNHLILLPELIQLQQDSQS